MHTVGTSIKELEGNSGVEEIGGAGGEGSEECGSVNETEVES